MKVTRRVERRFLRRLVLYGISPLSHVVIIVEDAEIGDGMDAEKQDRIIKFLIEKLTKLHREEEVFRLFVDELREKDQIVGIPERIHRIRNSQEVKDRVAAYFRGLDSLILGKEELPDRALQELIQQLGLSEGKSN